MALALDELVEPEGSEPPPSAGGTLPAITAAGTCAGMFEWELAVDEAAIGCWGGRKGIGTVDADASTEEYGVEKDAESLPTIDGRLGA
jgi:hypothetical protein